ncbi:GNAT family N-acetyltransferase [Crocinitomicaceae bacterium]|nr:GNAT family N-acetyltransferase [Crocinitomicaceae bacterium]
MREKYLSILIEAFRNNRSVKFVVKHDNKKEQRLKLLMKYSYWKALHFGSLYMNEDESACAFVVDSSKKKFAIASILWDLKLIFYCIGVFNLSRALKREKILKTFHPSGKFYHVWYIGVKEEAQGKGVGTELMNKIIMDCKDAPIHLETSMEQNFPFYERLGFEKVIDLKQDKNVLRMYRKA